LRTITAVKISVENWNMQLNYESLLVGYMAAYNQKNKMGM
jgi:hypothetical protein